MMFNMIVWEYKMFHVHFGARLVFKFSQILLLKILLKKWSKYPLFSF